ncbi:RILP-like protein 1 isoform X2 [Lingula anatina]|uniref:RILP-like protein 1 isoform X2 n=1 Tax=Lingula anatina TaxID=7574 RepID=A0A1S3JV50_LINAN|nr:RILP-like protein 1 isoform X2 [Lingula anatina]|eukprot:XP_013413976.1 RILP-like protein 1 isoform X2 [Lingula anatina]
MPYKEKDMEELANITVVDVYDTAAAIGKEFEALIDNYGTEAVTDLMPKVIRVLEQLEALANKNEKENNELADLRSALQRMEAEKMERAAERAKYEQELEQIEDTWKNDAKDLLQTVAKLQEENRRLHTMLEEKKVEKKEERKEAERKTEEEEIRIMTKLKETVDKQRDQLRALDRVNKQKTVDIEALQAQLERMAKVNTDLRRKTNHTTKQAKHLIEEKSDLQVQLQDKEQQIHKIQEMLKQQEVEHHAAPPPQTPDDDEVESLEQKLQMIGKMVIDLKDPNRPRFTLSELREVLLERNELKTRLIEVEEELGHYKPKEEDDADGDESPPPVQGPINKEPFEKLYPDYKESGIRKFFRRLLERLEPVENID